MSRRRRRRMNGCARCSIVLVVLLVISVAATYAGGMFAWGKFVEPKAGITFPQALSLASGLYSGREKKIVSSEHAHKEEDLNTFYSELKNALFLDESVDIKNDFSNVILELINNKNENQQAQESQESQVVTTSSVYMTEPESADQNSEGASLTGNETLDNFLKELDFDFSKLKDYEDEYLTPHVLSVNGKQLAAFLNDAISNIMTSDLVKDKLPKEVGPINLSTVDLSKAVRIPQIVIENDDSFVDQTKVSFKMTVAIELRDVAKQVLKSINSALGVVSLLIPKTLYVSATIYPEDPTQPAKIDINGFNDKRVVALETLLDKVLSNTQYGSFEQLMTTINEIVITGIEKIENVVPIVFVDNGCVEAKPIKALMSALKITELTETQFFCMIRDICLPTFDDVKVNMKFDENVKESEINTNLEIALDEFITEATKKYAIEEGYLKKDILYQQLTTIDSDDPNKESLEDHIDTSRLSSSLTSPIYEPQTHKVPIKYLAFGGLMNSYLNENPILSDGLNIDFKIINLNYDEATTTLQMVIEASLLNALLEKTGEDSVAGILAKQLIPNKIYIAASVNILDSSETKKADIIINNNNVEETKNHLNSIIALGNSLGINADSLKYDDLSKKIATAVINGLEKIETELKTEIIFTEEKALLPSVYEILAVVALKEAGVADPITDEDLYHIVYNLKKDMPQNFADASAQMGITQESNQELSMGNFIANLTGKYAIENRKEGESEDFITQENVYQKLTNIAGENSLVNRIKVSSLATENAYSEENHQVETEYLALTKLLSDYIKDNQTESGTGLKPENYNLTNIKYEQATLMLSLFVQVKLFTLINLDETSTVYKIATKILPEDVFLEVKVKLEKVDGSIVCNILVLGLDEEESQAFLSRIIKLGKSIGANLDAFDYTSLTNTLGENVFNGMEHIKTSLGVGIEFKENACYMPSIYKILSNKILHSDVERNLESIDVFEVIQELAEIPVRYKDSNRRDLNYISGFVEDFNDKYSINDDYKLSVNKPNSTIVDQMTALAGAYDSAIDGANLAIKWNEEIRKAESTLPVGEVLDLDSLARNIFALDISQSELCTIFGDAVDITSSGLENIELKCLFIDSASQMTLIFSCTYVQTGENNYSGILPEFVVKVVLDTTKIVGTDEACCKITINDMPYEKESSEENSTLDNFDLMCKRLSKSSTQFSIENTTNDCNGIIKTKFSSMFEKIPLYLYKEEKVEGHVVPAHAKIGSIYDVIYNAIKPADNSFNRGNIATTIAALHENFVPAGQQSFENITSTTITGKNLGQIVIDKGFNEIASTLGVNSSSIQVYQSAIVSIPEGTLPNDARRGFTDKFTAYTWAPGGYAVVTLEINTENMSYSSTLLPQHLHVTAITSLQKDTENPLNNGATEVIYNYFTANEMTVLDTLAGEKINMASVKANMKTYINDLKIYETYTLGNVIASGIGMPGHSEENGKVNGTYTISIT